MGFDPDHLGILTPKQWDVIVRVAQGKSNKVIARELEISPNTVKSHISKIYGKLNCGRADMVLNNQQIRSAFENRNKNHTFSISPESIVGIWMSKFTFISMSSKPNTYTRGVEFSMELLKESDGNFSIHGENIHAITEKGPGYFHNIRCNISKSSMIGFWENRNTENFGCFQLSIHTTRNLMRGKHLGIASDNTIQSGDWEWLRITGCENEMRNSVLKSFKELEGVFHNSFAMRPSLSAATIMENLRC